MNCEHVTAYPVHIWNKSARFHWSGNLGTGWRTVWARVHIPLTRLCWVQFFWPQLFPHVNPSKSHITGRKSLKHMQEKFVLSRCVRFHCVRSCCVFNLRIISDAIWAHREFFMQPQARSSVISVFHSRWVAVLGVLLLSNWRLGEEEWTSEWGWQERKYETMMMKG